MKILWLTNIALPVIAKDLNKDINAGGGWMVGLSNDLLKEKDIDLTVCFPLMNEKHIIKSKVENLNYYGYPQKKSKILKYDKKISIYFEEILNEINPDIVHIFGTEFPHSLNMVEVCNRKNIKFVISIQGLSSKISEHYLSDIPIKTQKHFTFRDFIKQDNIIQQKQTFYKRGLYEIKALKNTENIIGRTTWDKASTYLINPNANYFVCNESLRDSFYFKKWDLKKCEKYSIFITQGSYPIKGIHYMLEAMPFILREYPHAKLYIAGEDITDNSSIYKRIKRTTYSKYLKQLIVNNSLQDNVIFTGILQENEILNRFLNAHVFVSSSSIENESNSLSEAKIMGIPSVASYVGGVTDRINHGEDGFLYHHNAPYMLAYYILTIFKNDELARNLSKNATISASVIHDKKANLNSLLDIYKTIINYEGVKIENFKKTL